MVAGIGELSPMPSEYRPIGLSEPSSSSLPPQLPFTPSLSFTDSHGVGHPVEAITMSTLHGVLTRVLEQTYALWQAQASTNYILHEVRRSIPAFQENAKIHERLVRVEALTDALVHAERLGQGASTTPSTSFIPQNVSTLLSSSIGGTSGHATLPNSHLPLGPMVSSQETGKQYPSGPNIYIHRSESVEGETPEPDATVNSAIFPTKMWLPEHQQGDKLDVRSLPPTIRDDSDKSLSGTPGNYVYPTTHAYMPPEQNSVALENPPIPLAHPDSFTDLDELDQNATQNLTTNRAPDPPVAVSLERQPFPTECEHKRPLEREFAPGFQLDNKNKPAFVTHSSSQVADRSLGNQLITMIQEVLTTCKEQRAESAHWKAEWHTRMSELTSLVSQLMDEQRVSRQREEEQRVANAWKPGIESVLQEVQRCDAEQQERLNALSDAWRADNSRQFEETINAVRTTANKQVSFNVQGYLDEFSKSLSAEVRMLLGEVGKLREERRRIQYETGYLMSIQSTFREVGVSEDPPGYPYPQEWPSPAGIPLPESPQPRSGWHTLQRRRRPPRLEASLAPERRTQPWATWQPNPAFAPSPSLLALDHGSPGLFGPRSPVDSPSSAVTEIEESSPLISPRYSWATWQPVPALAPTPPPVEPAPLIRKPGSPEF